LLEDGDNADLVVMRLTLKLLGACSLQDASGGELRLPTRKTRALLAYLAVHAGTRQPRERLMALLWSDRAEPQARQSLNAALNALRKLGQAQDVALIESERDSAGLIAGSVDIDVCRFRELKNSDPTAAAKLYQGPFLDGFASPDDGFAEWLPSLRQQLHREACHTLREASARAAAAGDSASAISFAERSLELDPLQEDVHREVVRLYLSAGNRTRAMRQYENCVSVLRSELGVEPAEETRQLLTLMRSDRTASTKAPAPSTAATQNRGVSELAATQHVRFCTSADGTRIAYAKVGVGPPILKAPNFLNHIEYEWTNPIWNAFLAELARQNALVRFDQRGTGLSDWHTNTLSMDSMIEDIEAVVEATDLDRFALFGISQGAGFSLRYATTHPEQVSCIRAPRTIPGFVACDGAGSIL
jgi:DNA-binding SARP family transcriptional activator